MASVDNGYPLATQDAAPSPSSSGLGSPDDRKSISSTSREAEPGVQPVQQGDTLSRGEIVEDNNNGDNNIDLENASDPSPPYSSFSPWAKRGIVFGAAIGALFSPLSAQIYFPALNVVAHDLGVSESQITLSVTTYMVFQGLTPMFLGGFADSAGRRPAYAICFVIYVAANIGLALINNYGGLLAVRCLQSAGASSTVALCQAVVADVVTSAERGSYIGITAIPIVLAPSLGPVLGGVLSQYLGWRSIFWFLAIFAGVAVILFLLFFPETCRPIVGDGSVRPHPAYLTVYQLIKDLRRRGRRRTRRRDIAEHRRQRVAQPSASSAPTGPSSPNAASDFDNDGDQLSRRASAASTISQQDSQRASHAPLKMSLPNPWSSIKLLLKPPIFLLCAYSSVVLAGFYAVATAIPSQFSRLHGFNDLQIGLVYLPVAAGSIGAAFALGPALNWNFRRHAARLGIPVDRKHQTDLTRFPIERARLEVGFPLLAFSVAVVMAWGWAVERSPSIAAPVVLLFLFGVGMIGFNNASNVLLVDLCQKEAGAAVAANNLTRCLVGAGASAAILPMIDAMGSGWAFVVIGSLYVVFCPTLFLLVSRGQKWRAAEDKRSNKKRIETAEDAKGVRT